jgi:hypothetical protein
MVSLSLRRNNVALGDSTMPPSVMLGHCPIETIVKDSVKGLRLEKSGPVLTRDREHLY